METATLPENRLCDPESREIRIDAGEVLSAVFERFGSCIIHGCEVRGRTITSGIVALAGIEDGKRIFRIVRFGGADNVSDFPSYLVLCKSSGVFPPGRVSLCRYHAELCAEHPGLPCLAIGRDGGREFTDAFRDEWDETENDEKNQLCI